jgi:fructan beta-fructosidase
VLVRYDNKSNKLFMGRGNSGNSDFHEDFLKEFEANLLTCNTLKVQIIVDKCSVEIFVNDGEAVITNLIFPFEEGSLIKISALNGSAKIKTLNLYELNV